MKAKIVKVERKGGKYLVVHLDKTIDFKPGNTIDVVLGNDRRTFSIASKRGEPLMFATIDSSPFKKNLEEGKEVEVEGPFEDEFVIKEAKDHVFVAKGIGITPVRSMVLDLISRGVTPSLFYETDHVIFEDLGDMTTGRMPTAEDVKSHSDAFFYVSGTPSDTKEITSILVKAGVKPGRFVVEPFSGYD